MSSDKKVLHYSAAAWDVTEEVVGQRIWLTPVEVHPDVGVLGNFYGIHTSPVVEYDETTGIIETLNTVYVPSPNSQD